MNYTGGLFAFYRDLLSVRARRYVFRAVQIDSYHTAASARVLVAQMNMSSVLTLERCGNACAGDNRDLWGGRGAKSNLLARPQCFIILSSVDLRRSWQGAIITDADRTSWQTLRIILDIPPRHGYIPTPCLNIYTRPFCQCHCLSRQPNSP